MKNYNLHGGRHTKLYDVWCGMKARCLNKNNKAYKYYGGKGINVCEDWCKNFKNFQDWASDNGYEEGLSIDRIDVNGNYEPSNCRWTTM